MTEKNILKMRVSARDFISEKIELETLKEIIREGQLAPSWENSQPWKTYLAIGDTLEKIRQAHGEKVKAKMKSWTEVVPPLEWAEYPKSNIDTWFDKTKIEIGEEGIKAFWDAQGTLFNSQAIIYITVPKNSSHYSTYDTGAFAYGLSLAAAQKGIATVPAYEFIRFPEEVRSEFNISDDESLLVGIALGYPSNSILNTIKSSRNDLDTILQIRD